MTVTIDQTLPQVTDEMLDEARRESTPFTVVILKAGPRFAMPKPDRNDEITQIIRQHGKRNYALHLAGVLPVVCPIGDGSGVAGVGVFRADEAEVVAIMDGDPAVKADVLAYEVHPTQTFTIAASDRPTPL